ncbi:MAG: VOC family protein [Gemmatimonadetes bacterium]|nr:VOC family protein [Gemmatimonadota bacterium]
MKIQDIRHVGLLSPAIASHARFYIEAWELLSVGEGRSTGEGRHAQYFHGASADHHILSLHASERRGLHHLAFSVDGCDAVDAAATELEGRGITFVAHPGDLDKPGGGYGLRFLDPENRCIELSAAVTRHANGGSDERDGPGERDGSDECDGPGGRDGSDERVAPDESDGLRRLCHVGLNTARFDQIVAFYTDVLGFRVSDWIEDRMVFLRSGRRHHAIVFTRADHASVNHVAYGMSGVDAVMRRISNLRALGREPDWGPGRHGPGNNIFCYYTDPAGYVIECSSDLVYIEDEVTHEPAVWRRGPETLDYWGTAGAPDPDVRKAMAGDPDPGWTAQGLVED